MKKWSWIFLLMILVGGIFYMRRVDVLDFARAYARGTLPAATPFQETKPTETTSPAIPESDRNVKPRETQNTFAAEMNLAVPFTSQAPFADWNQPFQDACEEASILMVKEYYARNTSSALDKNAATKAILEMAAFEVTLLGYNKDTTVQETAQLAEKMFGFAKSDVLVNPTLNQIKMRLNNGEPVIVPLAGQLLKNPYFTPPGPTYHMAVIRGYTKNNQFIVNDPGTKRGNAYLYSFDIILDAIHDWNGEGDILEGKKRILILHPGDRE